MSKNAWGYSAAAFFLAVFAVAGPAIANGAKQFGETKSEHWGVITRNTIGSPVADLRAGPYGSFGVTGSMGDPPFGKGSLGIEVAAVPGSVEKVDFGNEVDFFGDKVSALKEVGFRVFQTGENAGFTAGVQTNPGNMPVIRLEIDPTGTGGYTTMVWVPSGVPDGSLNRWSGYINATTDGALFFTGSFGTTSGCNQTIMCAVLCVGEIKGPQRNGLQRCSRQGARQCLGRCRGWPEAEQHDLRSTLMSAEHRELRPAGGVPQPRRTIVRGGHNACAAGREGGGAHLAGMPAEHGDLCPGGSVPQPRRAIVRGGHDARAIGREGSRAHGIFMSRTSGYLAATQASGLACRTANKCPTRIRRRPAPSPRSRVIGICSHHSQNSKQRACPGAEGCAVAALPGLPCPWPRAPTRGKCGR